jgi:hypothetical protein
MRTVIVIITSVMQCLHWVNTCSTIGTIRGYQPLTLNVAVAKYSLLRPLEKATKKIRDSFT